MRDEKLKELKKYMEELKTIESINNIDSKKFLEIKTSSYLLNNGKTIIRDELVKNNNGEAISILAINKNNEVILVIQPRPLTIKSVTVELPAGYVDKGETPIVAAERELMEETGYYSNNIKQVSVHYQDQGCSRALIYSFVAFDCELKASQSLDESEYIRYITCTYDEALELMEMGYIMDANSIITLEKSKKYIGGKYV